ncbi:unnamed protein product [Parnassius apollo]|uniref:TATA box-binding protein-associated factor RNA polymerase I subunit B n=1 Tax=Parnassius apollo TaxID=110799 RepID=A0A8S3XEP8_PARAO|nr:unnamed protein product [Parnassius apollo]
MKNEPCNVCGSRDLNLIDGFYYCVECGTQDINVRETIVEQTYLADGTLALVGGKRFSTIVKDGIEMSGEWHKWHAYNFILAGLTDELIGLGAKPSVKMKVLWIWTRYIKRFQVKEDLELKSKTGKDSLNISQISKTQIDNDNSEQEEESEVKKKKIKSEKFTKDIKIVTKGLLLAILYVALNLDKSDIQLSHLFRFIKEGRLSFLNCTKYIPKEIDIKAIPHWKSFILCQSDYNSHSIRAYAMTCIKALDLGLPFVPDLKKIINNYMKELCLPNDFKNLVYSLMLYHPCDYLDIDRATKSCLVRLPDYENAAMSYVLVALKICFGLDCDYEMRISDVVDKINYEENHLKSHKLGIYLEITDRLFSFREWTRFLQFRKIVLCQHYLPMARQYNQEVDDYVLMEHLEERNKHPVKLRDEVTMDILNKIPYKHDIKPIPKTEFQACLTPMSTYTDVIVTYVLDDELRLLLSEDFTQYALKYATEDLKLFDQYMKNLIVGVSNSYKKIESAIRKNFDSKKGNATMVFVRNCENKNWLKTQPPAAEHITKFSENKTCESDHGDDSCIEITPDETNKDVNDIDCNTKLEYFEEEKENINIFDDNFDDFNEEDKSVIEPFGNSTEHFNDSRIDGSDIVNSRTFPKFDPDNFDKAKIINELILSACTKYKITLPKENKTRVSRKRRNDHANTDAEEIAPKKKKPMNTAKLNDGQMKVNDVIAAYYNYLDCDELTKVSEQVKHAVDAIDNNHEEVFNETQIFIHSANSESENVDNTPLNNSDHFVQSDVISDTLCTDNLNDTNSEQCELDTCVNKYDSDFDEKTHDIKQLYVKLNSDTPIDNVPNVSDDVDIDRIISNKIQEFTNYDENLIEDVGNNDTDSSDNDEDDYDFLEKSKFEKEKIENQNNLEPLIKHPLKKKEFKYWIRHYNSRTIGKNLDMHQKFDTELKDKYPASFYFVISECAAVLGCSTYSLYKGMQSLEEIIFAKSN